MNWWFRGKLAYFLAILFPIGFIYVTDDLLGMGILSWFEQSFGRGTGVLVYWFVLLVLVGVIIYTATRKRAPY